VGFSPRGALSAGFTRIQGFPQSVQAVHKGRGMSAALQAAGKLCFVSGHDFSRVPMNLRLTQGDENHSDFPIMILKGLDVVFDCAVND
jgi:hypothetical protein